MIRIRRGTEPPALSAIREGSPESLGELHLYQERLAAYRKLGGEIFAELTGYRVAKDRLFTAQHMKCAYCEWRVPQKRNDVEHFRPKAEADRRPGAVIKTGYWWLAWTWENLLFSCSACNTDHKKTQFPLALGSRALRAMSTPPGRELALLLDPGGDDNPIDHIQFVPKRKADDGWPTEWRPCARNGSLRGDRTIRVLGLDRPALQDRYDAHLGDLRPQVEHLDKMISRSKKRASVQEYWKVLVQRRLCASGEFAALSYDALDYFFPTKKREDYGLNLPWPDL